MRHSIWTQRVVGANAALFVLAAAPAPAEFVGGGVVSLQQWTDAANATQLPIIAGGKVRVYRIYAAFDGQDPARDTVMSAFDVDIAWSDPLVDATTQFHDSGDPFQNDAVQWDSFVTINVDDLQQGVAAGADGNGINFGANQLMGGWFIAAGMQGLAGTNGGADDFGTGLNLVMLAQITVRDDAPGPVDIVDIRTDGAFGNALRFSICLSLGLNDPQNPAIQGICFLTPPPFDVPATFSLLSPSDGAIVPADATFEWTSSENATTFQIEIAQNGDFVGSLVHNSTFSVPLVSPPATSSNTPPAGTLLAGATYGWRVTAINHHGATSSTPLSRAFTVAHVSDFNFDGATNGIDLAVMLASWGPCPGAPDPCPADIAAGGDGVVDGEDLARLLTEWNNPAR